MIFNQNTYDIKCEWGSTGIEQLAPVSDVIIIVDVLSFSTCVDVAVSQGAEVFPYKFRDNSAFEHAKKINAICADIKRSDSSYSLSPVSLIAIQSGTRLVLPSPNGSNLSLFKTNKIILCGCLRNCQARCPACHDNWK